MFLKPFRIKSNTAIKGSERKKIRAAILEKYNITDEDAAVIIPNKETMSVMKVFTHSGSTVFIYQLAENPVFFEVENHIYPTVYLLWLYPELLPAFETWPPVLENLKKGADLMLPGVIIKGDVQRTLAYVKKGQMCSVILKGNQAPVAVGKTALSGEDMFMSAMRGKGVIILHTFGDHLWALGDKSQIPLISVQEVTEDVGSGNQMSSNCEKSKDDCIDELKEGEPSSLDNSKVSDQPGESSLSSDAAGIDVDLSEIDASNKNEKLSNMLLEADAASQQSSKESDLCKGLNINVNLKESKTDSEAIVESDGIENEDGTDSRTPAEKMDALFYSCFCSALKTSTKKIELPLLTSTFYSAHMMPWCPVGQKLDIKKSTYKKLSFFLRAMEKRGFIALKELTKGVESVIKIDRGRPELKEFCVDETVLQVTSPPEAKAFSPPEITELLSVNAAVLPLFSLYGYKKHDTLLPRTIRELLTQYVKSNELQSSDEPNRVIIDPLLADIVLSKKESDTHLKWDTLIKRVQDKMQPAYEVKTVGEPPVVKKGKLQPIQLSVATRASNKKVTLIQNIETYGIDPEEFAHRVQLAVACSTSVSELPGKAGGSQVLVQGNQIRFIGNLLTTTYNLNKKYLAGMEHATKKKK